VHDIFAYNFGLILGFGLKTLARPPTSWLYIKNSKSHSRQKYHWTEGIGEWIRLHTEVFHILLALLPVIIISDMHHYESPEWMILSHVNCFIQGEVVGFIGVAE